MGNRDLEGHFTRIMTLTLVLILTVMILTVPLFLALILTLMMTSMGIPSLLRSWLHRLGSRCATELKVLSMYSGWVCLRFKPVLAPV